MKIFLDGRIPTGGIGRHVRWLRQSLAQSLDPESYTVYGRETEEKPAQRALPRSAAGALRRVAVDQWQLPRLVARSQADVFHSPNYLVPRRLSIPAVVNCYDLTLCDRIETKKRGPMKYYERLMTVRGLARARIVVTPSDAVRQELLRRFDLDPKRVVTIYPAIPSGLDSPEATHTDVLPDVARAPFLLTVGTLEPRKNLLRLIEAHQQVWRAAGIPLLLVGAYGWRQKEVLRRVRRSGGAVRWLGWVPDPLLAALYRKAVAVVQPSLQEGFDLPVLEALGAGAPLLLSDLSVHRELAGELALYAPPQDVERLSDRLVEVVGWSEAQRSEYARGAAARVEVLGARSGVHHYLRIYERTVGN